MTYIVVSHLSPDMKWHKSRKNDHFSADYQEVCYHISERPHLTLASQDVDRVQISNIRYMA